MQQTTILQRGNGLLGPKTFQQKDQELWQSCSKCSSSRKTDQDQLITGGDSGSSDVAQTVRCACCGVPEVCTAAYIHRVRAAHCGNWVCGLCTEAIGELLHQEPGASVEGALRSHTAVCRDFNATTRLNPKLSLAGSMRDIARRSFKRRAGLVHTDVPRRAPHCQDDGEDQQLPSSLLSATGWSPINNLCAL